MSLSIKFSRLSKSYLNATVLVIHYIGMKILEGLNEKQQEAVQHIDGPLLILAGAGSGKTKTLTHRVAYLIAEKGVAQENILAATFTNKAAKEMRHRIGELLGMSGENRSFMPFMGTFHGLCVRILRIDAEHAGLSRSFVIFDGSDQLGAVKQAMREMKIPEKEYSSRSVLSLISGAKNEMISPKEYERFVTTPVQKVASRVYKRYQEIITAAEALDFDDLISKTVDMLANNKEVRKKWQTQFKYIMVDEYQDTNAAQYRLVKLLTSESENLIVVGDDWQSIYSWRGADFKNILNFERDYPKTKVIKLEQNYRSTQKILDAAHAVIHKNEQRTDKKLWTDNKGGEPVKIEQTMDEVAEGEYIVRQARAQVEIGARSWNDFAVLYRTNAQSRSVEEICIRYGVPYRVVGGVKFYDRKEVKDIIAYLRFIFQPEDLASFLRIVNTPARGIGQTSMQKFLNWANYSNLSLWQALQQVQACPDITSRAVKSLTGFTQVIVSMREYNEDSTVSALIDALVRRINYIDHLDDDSLQAAERIENIRELQSVARDYDSHGLAGFLEEVALVADVDTYDADSDALTLMTMHSAKGLEFPVVFIVGMEESIFPHNRALYDVSEMEEERRLCYVAMTRAKEELYLLHAGRRLLYGGIQRNLPSRFLSEADESYNSRHAPSLSPQSSAPKRDTSYNEPRVVYDEPVTFKPNFGEPKQGGRRAENIKVGDTVRHKIFGTGDVESMEGDVASIKFRGRGLKKLNTSFAPLEVV